MEKIPTRLSSTSKAFREVKPLNIEAGEVGTIDEFSNLASARLKSGEVSNIFVSDPMHLDSFWVDWSLGIYSKK